MKFEAVAGNACHAHVNQRGHKGNCAKPADLQTHAKHELKLELEAGTTIAAVYRSLEQLIKTTVPENKGICPSKS